MNYEQIRKEDYLLPDKNNSVFSIEIVTGDIYYEQDLYKKDDAGLIYIQGCDEFTVISDLSFTKLGCDKSGNLVEQQWNANEFARFRDNDCAWCVSNTWLPLTGTAKQRYTGVKNIIQNLKFNDDISVKLKDRDKYDNIIIEISCCVEEKLKCILSYFTIAESTTMIASLMNETKQYCNHQIKKTELQISVNDISCRKSNYKQLLYLYGVILMKGWSEAHYMQETHRKYNALLQAWILHLSISMPRRAPVEWMIQFIWQLLDEADSEPPMTLIDEGNGGQLMFATHSLIYMVRCLSRIETNKLDDINVINEWLTFSMDAYDDGWYRAVAQFYTEMYYCIIGSDICPRRLSRLILMGVIVTSNETDTIYNSGSMCAGGICHCQDQEYGDKLKNIKKKTIDKVKYRRDYGEGVTLSHVWGQQLILGDYNAQILKKLLNINSDIWIDIYCPSEFTPDDFKEQYNGNNVLVLDRAIMLGLHVSNIDAIALIASSEWAVRGWTYQESRMAAHLSFVAELDEEFRRIDFNTLSTQSSFRLAYAKRVLGLSAENTMQDYNSLHNRAWSYSSNANICENLFYSMLNRDNRLTWWQFYASIVSKTKKGCWFGGNLNCDEKVVLACQCRQCNTSELSVQCRIPHSSGAIKLESGMLEVKGILLSVSLSNTNRRIKIKDHYLPIVVEIDCTTHLNENLYAMFPKLCSNRCPCNDECRCDLLIQYGYLLVLSGFSARKIGTVIIPKPAKISGPISKIVLE